MKTKKYDVVIVGAGPGGAIAAKTLDNSGLSVCLIDAKPRENIGEKVCGDAIEKEIFDFLHEKLNLDYPNKEVKNKVKGIKIFSPDKKTIFKIETKNKGYLLDRLKFGQHLLRQIKKATLMDNTLFVDFFDEGVVVERKINNKTEIEKIKCKIVVDASGFNAIVRTKTADNIFFEKNIDKKDISMCYREIREQDFEDQDYCHIYMTNEFSHGGYVWEFPEGKHLNVGLGVLYPSIPKMLYDKYLDFKGEEFKNSKIIKSGGGVVPTRRPIDSLVAMHNKIGVMFVGDAACQVNPIHGGGIARAMRAGYLAGTAIKKIYKQNKNLSKISLTNLWEYNSKYMKNQGKNIAVLDLFRIFLQSLSDDQINFGMGIGLIKEKDLINLSNTGEIKLNIVEKISRLAKGISDLNTTKKFIYTLEKIKKIKKLYGEYPNQEGFLDWKKSIEKIYIDLKKNML